MMMDCETGKRTKTRSTNRLRSHSFIKTLFLSVFRTSSFLNVLKTHTQTLFLLVMWTLRGSFFKHYGNVAFKCSLNDLKQQHFRRKSNQNVPRTMYSFCANCFNNIIEEQITLSRTFYNVISPEIERPFPRWSSVIDLLLIRRWSCVSERAKSFWEEVDVDEVFDDLIEVLSLLREAIRHNTATDRGTLSHTHTHTKPWQCNHPC